MTAPSSSTAPGSGWERLQGLLDEFRAEHEQTERFMAETLDHLTLAVGTALAEADEAPAAVADPRVEQLVASSEQDRAAMQEACRSTQTQFEQLTETIRKGFDELIELARGRSEAEKALGESLRQAMREEREGEQASMAEFLRQQQAETAAAVEAAVAGAVEKVVTHAMEEHAAKLAKTLAEHRSMVALLTNGSGTEASPPAGAGAEARPASTGDAVLDSIRMQFELLQRQTARRRGKSESRT